MSRAYQKYGRDQLLNYFNRLIVDVEFSSFDVTFRDNILRFWFRSSTYIHPSHPMFTHEMFDCLCYSEDACGFISCSKKMSSHNIIVANLNIDRKNIKCYEQHFDNLRFNTTVFDEFKVDK